MHKPGLSFSKLIENGYIFVSIYELIFKPLLMNRLLDCHSLANDIRAAEVPSEEMLLKSPSVDALLNQQFCDGQFRMNDSSFILNELILNRFFGRVGVILPYYIDRYLRGRVLYLPIFSYHSLLEFGFYDGWTLLEKALKKENRTTEEFRSFLSSSALEEDIKSFLFTHRVISLWGGLSTKYMLSILKYVCLQTHPSFRVENIIGDIAYSSNKNRIFFRTIKSLSFLNDYIYDSDYRIEFINSLEDALEIASGLKGAVAFYRGHSDANYLLVPSLFRDPGYLKKEGRVLRFVDENATDLAYREQKNLIDKLFFIQHFASNTRLLDVTEDIRIALFFACSGNPEKDGRLFVMRVNESKIQKPCSPYITNICDVLHDDRLKELLSILGEKTDIRNYSASQDYCVSLRNRRVRSFTIKSLGLKRNYLIRVDKERVGNHRLKAQKGSFLMFGLTDNILKLNPRQQVFYGEIKQKIIYCIPHEAKRRILEKLSAEGVDVASLMGDVKTLQEEAFSKYH